MRQSPESIAERRRRNSSVFLLTGGTGFIGSHIAVELLKRGSFVHVLCRPKKGVSARDRMGRLLQWFGIEASDRIHVIEGQVSQPLLGLDQKTYDDLVRTTDEVFHCMADTSFADARRPHLEVANVEGTRHVLQLATEGHCSFFHYMSTAYVAGRRQGLCPEVHVPAPGFHNPYEETKHAAEGCVLEICRREGIRANIYRPSIVYGDSRHGRSLLFNAFYHPVRIAHSLKTICVQDFQENQGANAAQMGVVRASDGTLRASVRIERTASGTLNLVPIDFVVQACMAIIEDSLEGGIYHLVNPRPNTLDELLVFMERYLSIEGIRLVPQGHLDGQSRNTMETLIGTYMDAYQAYFHDQRVFDTTQADRILARRGIVCPGLDYPLFARCIDYAIRVDWGRWLFEGNESGPQAQRA